MVVYAVYLTLNKNAFECQAISFFQFCCKCCQKKQIVKEEYALLALGLSDAGKSTLLSRLCGEDEEDSGPTNGMQSCFHCS